MTDALSHRRLKEDTNIAPCQPKCFLEAFQVEASEAEVDVSSFKQGPMCFIMSLSRCPGGLLDTNVTPPVL